MTTQIMLKNNTALGAKNGPEDSLSASLVIPAGAEHGDQVEIELRSRTGTSGTVRLSIDETRMFALVISSLVDDVRHAEAVEWDGDSITRDALIKKLLTLPPDATIGLQLFHETVGLSDLSLDADGSGLYPMSPVAADLEDVLREWGLTREQLVVAAGLSRGTDLSNDEG